MVGCHTSKPLKLGTQTSRERRTEGRCGYAPASRQPLKLSVKRACLDFEPSNAIAEDPFCSTRFYDPDPGPLCTCDIIEPCCGCTAAFVRGEA